MALELRLLRYSSQKIDTLGILKDEIGQFFCYSLEDEYRAVKVAGETRIPEGRYKLAIRKEATDLTIRHRAAYNEPGKKPWFEFHIEVTGIPNFAGVYIHAGNTEKHTEGCLLFGNTINNNAIQPGFLGDSKEACRRFYEKYYPILLEGKQEVFINIISI